MNPLYLLEQLLQKISLIKTTKNITKAAMIYGIIKPIFIFWMQ